MFLYISVADNTTYENQINDTEFIYFFTSKSNTDLFHDTIDNFIAAYQTNNKCVELNLLVWYNGFSFYNNRLPEKNHELKFLMYLEEKYPHYFNRFQKLLILR
jgi:hypothetical protein